VKNKQNTAPSVCSLRGGGRMCHRFQKPTQDRQFISQFVKYVKVNIGEHRIGNKKWTIQRNWQHRVHNTKKKQNKNTTQYVLDTTLRKQQKHNTICVGHHIT